MKVQTAHKLIQKEADFLGQDYFDIIVDVHKWGSQMFSSKVVEAVKIILEHNKIGVDK